MKTALIRAIGDVTTGPLPATFSGLDSGQNYFLDGEGPLQLCLCEITEQDVLEIGRSDLDWQFYIWRGAIEAGGFKLVEGSSLVVEHGCTAELCGLESLSHVLCFSARDTALQQRKGGQIHLLPAGSVPRYQAENGLQGGMHADSECPTCQLWLHENHFPPMLDDSEKRSEKGIHCHTEDEIIFVTSGEIHFGKEVGGPGTALSIPANKFYSFDPGPDGLSFVNFRASMPGDIRFRSGQSMSETGYWHGMVERPEYIYLASD